jgi:hypothetical protein
MNNGRVTELQKEGPVKCDDPTLWQRAAKLPPEMRESYIWLGIYFREQCQRNTVALARRIAATGVEFSGPTWSLVLRGHCFTDPNGVERPEPLMDAATFLKAVGGLKKSAAKEVKGPIPFVPTSTAREIIDAVDTARSPNWVNRFVIVIGETGNQKSATFSHIVRTIPNGDCVRFEALGAGLTSFLNDLDRCFGGDVQSSTERKKDHIRRALSMPTSNGLARVVIIDNAQRMLDARRDADQKVMNFLLKLQEDLDFAVILSFTPAEYSSMQSSRVAAFFEQFIGRAGGEDSIVRLGEYAPEEDLVLIAREFGFPDAALHKKKLVEISRRKGRIRTFMDVLQRAKALAGKGPITIDDIECVESRRVEKKEGK